MGTNGEFDIEPVQDDTAGEFGIDANGNFMVCQTCCETGTLWRLKECCTGFEVFTTTDLGGFNAVVEWDGKCWNTSLVEDTGQDRTEVNPANVTNRSSCADPNCQPCCLKCDDCCLASNEMTVSFGSIPREECCSQQQAAAESFFGVFENQSFLLRRGPATICGGDKNVGPDVFYKELSGGPGNCCYVTVSCGQTIHSTGMQVEVRCLDVDDVLCDTSIHEDPPCTGCEVRVQDGIFWAGSEPIPAGNCPSPLTIEWYLIGGSSACVCSKCADGPNVGNPPVNVGSINWDTGECGWGCDSGNCVCGECGTEVTCGECTGPGDEESCSPI